MNEYIYRLFREELQAKPWRYDVFKCPGGLSPKCRRPNMIGWSEDQIKEFIGRLEPLSENILLQRASVGKSCCDNPRRCGFCSSPCGSCWGCYSCGAAAYSDGTWQPSHPEQLALLNEYLALEEGIRQLDVTEESVIALGEPL